MLSILIYVRYLRLPQSRLFKIVSFITGFKNSMKGVGYFIGAWEPVNALLFQLCQVGLRLMS